MVQLGRGRLPGGDGLVQAGIERSAHRVDALQTGGLKLLAELPVHQVHGLPQRLRRRRSAVGVQAVHVIEHLQQADHQRRLRALGELVPLPRDPLAIVVVLRGQPEMAVPLFVELLFQTTHGLLGRLHRHARRAAVEDRLGLVITRRGLLGHVGGRHVGTIGALAADPSVVAHVQPRLAQGNTQR